MLRYPIPPILRSLGNSHAAIEASAGTGKTFTLEHLVVQLILEGTPLEQILVVTFTRKATLELIERVRAKLAELAGLTEGADDAGAPCWELHPEGLERVRRALTRFDQATIATIHGFCQQVLKEAAFEGGRLLRQEVVARDELFERAFTTLLRTRFAKDQPGALAIALEKGEGLEDLRKLLKGALAEGEGLDLPPHRDLRAALEAFPVDLAQRLLGGDPELCAPLAGAKGKLPVAVTRLLTQLCSKREAALAGDPAEFWRRAPLDPDDGKKWREADQEAHLKGDSERLARAIAELLNVDGLLVAAFLPPLQEEMERLKAGEGLFDFDDMIRLVQEALEGPQGPALVQRLRERFQVAVIDEFQDTDHRQWEIFRRIFLDSDSGHRLIVVGDPKQAIYGFRGGDLPTYVQATQAITARSGAPALQLQENWRSTEAVIRSYNALFEDSEGVAFFQGDNAAHYRTPVRCGRPELRLTDAVGRELPAIRTVAVPVGSARQTRAEAAGALARALRDTLASARFKGRPLRPEDVYILVHKGKEGRIMVEALREAGIPAAIYREEGLFDGPEAQACRDLLLALAAPQDPARRGRALLGPFFGLSYREVEQARKLPEGHPILVRLQAWKALAQQGRYGELFHRLAGESGMTRRLLFLEEGQRSLTNLLHILELLLHEALRHPLGPEDLAHLVQRWIEGTERPAVEDGETQRLERQRGAVQVLTMHKSKGLQAPVVVLFGGTGQGSPKATLHRYHREGDGARRAWIGPRALAPAAVDRLIGEEAAREEERLAYVALTRAEAQLILPHYVPGETPPSPLSSFERESAHPKAGPYRPINRRLRVLLGPEESPRERPGFERVSLPEAPAALPPRPWRVLLPEPPLPLPDFRALAARGRAHGIFSYTGMQRLLDQGREHPAARPEQEARQWGESGGKKLGIQVHAFLQEVDFAGFAEADFEAWQALPATRALAERHFPPQWRREALGWAHHALARPIGLPEGEEAILSRAEEHLRELDFLAPYPEERDYLTGSIDLLFRHGGRTYVLDWKTNLLPDYGPESLEASVREHYQLQLRIYTLTARAFLGIGSREAYERDFGGVVYVYLRGLPEGGGVWSRRPAWEELARWERELRDTHGMLVGGEAHD